METVICLITSAPSSAVRRTGGKPASRLRKSVRRLVACDQNFSSHVRVNVIAHEERVFVILLFVLHILRHFFVGIVEPSAGTLVTVTRALTNLLLVNLGSINGSSPTQGTRWVEVEWLAAETQAADDETFERLLTSIRWRVVKMRLLRVARVLLQSHLL